MKTYMVLSGRQEVKGSGHHWFTQNNRNLLYTNSRGNAKTSTSQLTTVQQGKSSIT